MILKPFLRTILFVPLGVDEVDYSLYPKREHQLKWIAVYLEEAARLRGTCNSYYSVICLEQLCRCQKIIFKNVIFVLLLYKYM